MVSWISIAAMVVSRNCDSGSILKVNVLVFAYGLKIFLKVKKKKIKEDSVFLLDCLRV